LAESLVDRSDTRKWPLGTEARLMFDILRCTFLRLGDVLQACGRRERPESSEPKSSPARS
jgi:hypothetical protein